MGVLSKQYFFSVTVLDDVFLTSFWVRLVTFGEAMNRFPKNSNDFQEPDQSLINGCFSWIIPNLYVGSGCLKKHPFQTGCLG